MENTLTPEQVIEKINTKFNESMSTMATKSDVESLQNDVNALKGLTEKSEAIQTAITGFEAKLEAFAEKAKDASKIVAKTLPEALGQVYAENLEKILSAKESGASLSLEVKADTTIVGNYTGNIALSTLEQGVSNIARPKIKVRDIVNKGTTTSKFVTYISQTVQTIADWTLEAGTKPTGSPEYIEVSEEVKKIAGTVKISKEMLADLSFVQSEINGDLMASVDQMVENGILNGAGGSEINGIIPIAPLFVAGSFATSIPSANISDVLRISVAQIESANFNATHVVLNPVDVAKLQLTKTTTGEYTYPMFLMDSNGEMRVASLIVVSTNNQTAGEFLVGDFTKSNVRVREAMNLQVGYVNDDFQRNMVTILCEMRLVQYVKNNDVNAFVKGNLATAISSIDLP